MSSPVLEAIASVAWEVPALRRADSYSCSTKHKYRNLLPYTVMGCRCGALDASGPRSEVSYKDLYVGGRNEL